MLWSFRADFGQNRAIVGVIIGIQVMKWARDSKVRKNDLDKSGTLWYLGWVVSVVIERKELGSKWRICRAKSGFSWIYKRICM